MNIKNLSMEQLAGQRLMVGFNGTELNDELKNCIDSFKIGGIILFSRNITDPKQMRNLTDSVNDYANTAGLPPLFIAIDQEGGTVSRLKHPDFTQFPEGANGLRSIPDARHFAEVTANELKSVGVNMNMAPVLDVEPPDFSGVMAKRVLGKTPDIVSELGCELIDTFHKNGIMSVGKHFPGIGRTTLDSHLHLPVLETEKEILENSDFLPFSEAVKRKVSGIMLSHILYDKLDPKWQASLSQVIAKKILREEIGFQGVTMTDDLDMKAIKHDIGTVTNQIIDSDIDITLICHSGPNIPAAFNNIIEKISSSDSERARSIESVRRIMGLKNKFLLK